MMRTIAVEAHEQVFDASTGVVPCRVPVGKFLELKLTRTISVYLSKFLQDSTIQESTS